MSDNSCLVVEGGAMRGVFAAGVLDAFMDQGYKPFDFAIGVSAGASNLLGYLADAPERSFKVISDLATSKRFFDTARFIRGGNLMDVRWLSEESLARYPIDLDKLSDSFPLYATTTNIVSGAADYFQITAENVVEVTEATTALPIAYKSTPCFSGGCYTDGGVADSIPVREAYRRGARDITVILSHPLSYNMAKTKSPWLLKTLFAKHPNVAQAMLSRAENYNQSLEFLRNPPADAKVRVIAPPENFPVKRLTRKRNLLEQGYEMGKKAGIQHVKNRRGEIQYHSEECHFCV
ncbi:patatin family protein [Vibrio sp. SCSIO 43136]|uniref:patatin-like phospholipase family protein n=1 Tax=Vibrio sp. SCSIO 43136 TaxID=2819101 RepID=UPI002075D0D2|nr:patatin family protein [Vibrio sp. SCSIO 43136]USD67847.1 patatin family protein [Vibrio sp. SCSIO 43136]